jgi:MFS family permease
LVVVAWMFGAGWMYITTGAAMTRYAQLLGVGGFGFGLLAALPYMGALAQLPSSFFIERYGKRKAVFLATGLAHRLLWLAVALIPWVLPDAWWWLALVLLVGLSSVSGHMATPAWVSWMADLVPARIRGRYFSRRMQIGQMVGLVVTLLVGHALDRAGAALMQTVSLALALAAVVGTIDMLIFLPVPEPATIQPDPQLSVWRLVRDPLRDRNFRRYLGFTATITFGIGYIPQFVWLYLFDVVGLSNAKANLMLVVVPLLVTMTVFPVWGRLIDRLGRKPVLIIAGLLVVHGGAVWIFVTPQHWFLGYMAAMIATAAWPGIEVANFNMLLSLSAASAGRRQVSAYLALNSMVAALAGIASGLFGGLVAEMLRDWRGELLGWPLTYHGVLFLISTLLRLGALGWLAGLEDRKAHSTRAALRYMGTNFYSNVQQAIFTPARVIQQFGRWTYRLNRTPRRRPPPPGSAGG